jgi:hypothetical protein
MIGEDADIEPVANLIAQLTERYDLMAKVNISGTEFMPDNAPDRVWYQLSPKK